MGWQWDWCWARLPRAAGVWHSRPRTGVWAKGSCTSGEFTRPVTAAEASRVLIMGTGLPLLSIPFLAEKITPNKLFRKKYSPQLSLGLCLPPGPGLPPRLKGSFPEQSPLPQSARLNLG